MGGRLRPDVHRAFECFAEVCAPDVGVESGGAKVGLAAIARTFPTWYKERQADQLKSVPQFVFPCQGIATATVQNFSFVLTNLEAQWTFGFVRHSPNADTALVMLSSLPWHETFYRVLNHAAELTHSQDEGELERFLEAVYKARLPDPGTVFHISWEATPNGSRRDFTCPIPLEHGLPSIPENRNLTEYYNAVGIHSMLVIFASMLFERRIIVTSKRLSRLSACVQAANAIIYPMHWQHIFIPVLPMQLIDYLSAPMPFLVGVPAPIMAKVKSHELGEVVVLDADTNVIRSPFSDLEYLPSEVTANLKRSLKSHRNLLGDSVARAFLQALVHLIGGYRDALKFRQGEKITFSDDAFVSSRSGTLQPFLEQMLQLQIFRQFVEERLTMLNTGRGFSDEFEDEVIRFQEAQNNNSKLKQQYAQISSSVKKEGGALVKAVRSKFSIKSRPRPQSALNQWATYHDKYKSTNPAVKSAVKSVKHGSRGFSTKSKSAYREMRSKMKTSSSSSLTREGTLQPNSAPSSPVLGHRASSFSSMSSIGSFTSTQHIPSSLVSSATPPVNDSGSSQGSSGFGGGVSSLSGSGGNRIHGLARNNTDLGFGRVLKYERFDPPALAGVPRNPFASNNPHTQLIADQSPEMEGPKPLDLDLMSDLQDVIFKTNHLNNNREQKQHPVSVSTPRAPPINRHGPEKARKPSAGDLIKLDSKSFEEEQDIFDPLFQPTPSGNHQPSPQLPMPKPPSASTLPQITKFFEQQAHQPPNHKPLQRSSGPNHNPFHNQNGNPAGHTASTLRPQGVMPHRALFTKSSDDLLQEYGIDFNTLSVASSVGNFSDSTTITHSGGISSNNSGSGSNSNNGHPMRLLTAQGSNPTKDPGLDPFADLDPLSAKQVGPPQSVNHMPLAPPRGIKKQHWTTFE
ncbi:DENN domain-containing protein 1A-like isoform X3 [Tigriopus californicus]|uniref:DENN domain-containing protein 1A-like isoform X3 n=1 Tax=Tigriopus californicus TaxID=6832 RepID=UPI0027DA5A15|nr:DENN domain-containing protein 1A-like isoform X3 [Tigriopus californicus]